MVSRVVDHYGQVDLLFTVAGVMEVVEQKHAGKNSQDGEQRSPEHHIHRVTVLLDAGMLLLDDFHDPGDGEEQVDLAEVVHHAGYHRVDVGLARHIAGDGENLRTSRFQFLRGPVELIELAGTNSSAASLVGQLMREGKAKPARTTGNEGDLPVQVGFAHASHRLANAGSHGNSSREWTHAPDPL
jgi:hypothetical protein